MRSLILLASYVVITAINLGCSNAFTHHGFSHQSVLAPTPTGVRKTSPIFDRAKSQPHFPPFSRLRVHEMISAEIRPVSTLKKFNWVRKKLLIALYLSAELTLHGVAFFTVNELTKNINIYFDTILFSYLSLSRKRHGKRDYKLYSLLALEHILFLVIKVINPSIYLEIFVTKQTIPFLYYAATFVECAAYMKVLLGW